MEGLKPNTGFSKIVYSKTKNFEKYNISNKYI